MVLQKMKSRWWRRRTEGKIYVPNIEQPYRNVFPIWLVSYDAFLRIKYSFEDRLMVRTPLLF